MTAYRNDVDALAARHAALEAEVADRTRERDEAARLLDEARGRVRAELYDREAPIRRQRAIAIVIFLAIGAIMGSALYKRVTHKSKSARLMEKLAVFENKMCACYDKACADKVNQEFTDWATAMAKTADEPDLPSPEDSKRVSDIVTHYSECMTKLLTTDLERGY